MSAPGRTQVPDVIPPPRPPPPPVPPVEEPERDEPNEPDYKPPQIPPPPILNRSWDQMMNACAWRLPSARASRSDGAAELRDKAAAIAAYARQRNDTELELWIAEIKLPASIRIG